MYNNNSEESTIECEQYVAIQKWHRGFLNKQKIDIFLAIKTYFIDKSYFQLQNKLYSTS